MKPNLDIRQTAKAKGVFLWEIADRLGVHDSNFSRMLRQELPKEKKEEIFEIISQLSREVSVNGC